MTDVSGRKPVTNNQLIQSFTRKKLVQPSAQGGEPAGGGVHAAGQHGGRPTGGARFPRALAVTVPPTTAGAHTRRGRQLREGHGETLSIRLIDCLLT